MKENEKKGEDIKRSKEEQPKHDGLFMRITVNLCRFILAATLLFSGFVKAVDPLGTQYKLQEYLHALDLSTLLPDWFLIVVAVGLAVLEFTLGMLLLFAIQRRLASRTTLVLMIVMTAVTTWLAISNPISDCGCFGDAIHLSNTQTLLKNILLTVCALVVTIRPLLLTRFISESSQWIVEHYTVLFIIGLSIYSLYLLPPFDFRPSHVGADIKKGMEIPEGAPLPAFETTFIMEKDGKQQEFTVENYPDTSWHYVDRRVKEIRKGYVPPIHDFSITDDDNDDITEEILDAEGYTFLLIAPDLEKADDSNFGEIDHIYEYSLDHGYDFLCLTASGEQAKAQWRDLTGAEYPIYAADQTTLKTLIRSNPGLMLLKHGVVFAKWSCNNLPQFSTTDDEKIFRQDATERQAFHNAKTMLALLMWFVLPLLLLTIADRLWAWTKHLNKKSTK